MKPSLLLTFDYEVFLGGLSGTVSRCLLEPTDEVLKVLDESGCKGLFFVDALYLHRLKHESSAVCRNDAESIIRQLDLLVKNGHEVAVHIHPHWLDARFTESENNWDGSDRRRFALSCFDAEMLEQIVQQSVEVLRPFMNMQQDLKFRAGGFYVQPFEHLLPVFRKHRLYRDFSVMRDFVSTGFENRYRFNYSSPPKSYIYRFASDPMKNEAGEFTEVSVNSFPLTGFTRLRNSWYYRRNKGNPEFNRMGDGHGSGNIIMHHKAMDWKSTLIGYQNFSIELMNPVIANGYLQFLRKEGYIHFVSHPKLFTQGGIRAFSKFLPLAIKAEAETDIESIINLHLKQL